MNTAAKPQKNKGIVAASLRKVPQKHLEEFYSSMCIKAEALHLLILFAGPAAAVHHPGEVRLYPGGPLEAVARAT